MKQRQIDPFSGSVVRLDCYTGSRKSGVAAGFLYARNGVTYLITNWHVATGRDANNPALSADGSFTTHVEVQFLKRVGDQILLTEMQSQSIQLNDGAGKGQGWLQHPTAAHLVDIAAIPIIPNANAANRCLNEPGNSFDRFILSIGDTIFVLGYPWGVGGAVDTLPIWKSGAVATIPGLDYAGKPCFLIDANTFRGMSGGPVICRFDLGMQKSRIHDFQQGVDPILGSIQYFCGVYSGRAQIMGSDGGRTETDLGYCWRPELIDQIIDGNKRGSAI